MSKTKTARKSNAGARLAEIDENLIRRDLTTSQRAKLVSKRKAAYEATHPEAKQGGDRRSTRQVGGLKKDSFVKDTAAKTGKPKRSVERDVTRAKRLGPDLDRVTGTSLDKGAELDALAAMPAPDRQAIIGRAAGGAAHSEHAQVTKPGPFTEPGLSVHAGGANQAQRRTKWTKLNTSACEGG